MAFKSLWVFVQSNIACRSWFFSSSSSAPPPFISSTVLLNCSNLFCRTSLSGLHFRIKCSISSTPSLQILQNPTFLLLTKLILMILEHICIGNQFHFYFCFLHIWFSFFFTQFHILCDVPIGSFWISRCLIVVFVDFSSLYFLYQYSFMAFIIGSVLSSTNQMRSY